jgi:hypothetical protein
MMTEIAIPVAITIADQQLALLGVPGPIAGVVSSTLLQFLPFQRFHSAPSRRSLTTQFASSKYHSPLQAKIHNRVNCRSGLYLKEKVLHNEKCCPFNIVSSLHPRRSPKSHKVNDLATSSSSSAAQVCQEINKKTWRVA